MLIMAPLTVAWLLLCYAQHQTDSKWCMQCQSNSDTLIVPAQLRLRFISFVQQTEAETDAMIAGMAQHQINRGPTPAAAPPARERSVQELLRVTDAWSMTK